MQFEKLFGPCFFRITAGNGRNLYHSLQMGDEDFDRIISELGDDGELLLKLRSMHNCVQLIATMSQKREEDPVCVSSSKVAIYEQHRNDLKLLKQIVKRYCPQNYDEIFRSAQAGNYVSSSRVWAAVEQNAEYTAVDGDSDRSNP